MKTSHKMTLAESGISAKAADLIYLSEDGPESSEASVIPLEAYKALRKYIGAQGNQLSDALPHQDVAIKDIQSHLSQGVREGYIEMATSTGKTYLIAKLAEAFRAAGLRTLILAPQIVIAEQIASNPDRGLARFARGIEKEEIGRHYGGYKATGQDSIVVSTYAGLNTFADSHELGTFDVVLADEAHRSLGMVTKSNLQNFSPGAIKIGFTATPDYGVDKRVNEIFNQPMHSISLPEAIEMNLVAPVQCLVYTTDAEIPYVDPQSEFTQKEIERLVHLKARNERAVEFAKNFTAAGRQGVISCVPGGNLAHARLLAKYINDQEVRTKNGERKFVRAVAVGSHQSREERSRILAAFENGEIDVLTFVSSLSEGWDSNRASFLINTCPTTSVVKITQLIGRVLRKKPDGLESIVVDFLDKSQRKIQATALSALGEERFVLGKVIGTHTGRTHLEHRTYLEGILDPDLWYSLQAADSKLLSELNVRGGTLTPEEQQIVHYERILAKEGLLPEPKNSMNVPKGHIEDIERFKRSFFRRFRLEPIEEDVETYIRERLSGSSSYTAGRLASLALHGYEAISINTDDFEIEEPDSCADVEDELVDFIARRTVVGWGLNALPERERKILELRFGYEGKPLTLEAIGHRLDLTRERVRDLEGQALVRLISLNLVKSYLEADMTPRERLRARVRQDIRRLEERINEARVKRAEFEDHIFEAAPELSYEQQQKQRIVAIRKQQWEESLCDFTKLLHQQHLIYIDQLQVDPASSAEPAPAANGITTSFVSGLIERGAKIGGYENYSEETQLLFKLHWLTYMTESLQKTTGTLIPKLRVPLDSNDHYYGWAERLTREAMQHYKLPDQLEKD